MSKTMLFNPYTGTPRHPSDIASDPQGILILDPDAPLLAATPQPAEDACDGSLCMQTRRCSYSPCRVEPAAQQAAEGEPTDEWEVRADGQRVRRDRWQWGIRRIVALLWGNRQQFEIDEVVEAVRALAPAPHVDDEALARAVQEGATPATQPAEPSELVDLLQRAVRRLEIEHSHGGSIMREWITEARAALAQHGTGKDSK